MTYAAQLVKTGKAAAVDPNTIASSIDALSDCANACMLDVDADLGVADVKEMVKCIRLCQNCADVCVATARVLSRPAEYQSQVTMPLLEACVAICAACGDECERHAQLHDHCRLCAQACRFCEGICRQMFAALK
jgi:hypothetical protein